MLHPVCLAGKGHCPPEDCGAIWGYYNMVEAINNPKHPEHKEIREWMGFDEGEKWDLNEFDLEAANKDITAIWDELRKPKRNKGA